MKNNPELTALSSAILFALSVPIFKIFLNNGVSPLYVGALAYFGAGCGMFLYHLFSKKTFKFDNGIALKDMPYATIMIFADIFAILLLTYGLKYSNSANASLLSNFEIVATSTIAFLFFKEKISKNLALGITLIVIASLMLTFEDAESISFQKGSIMILGAYFLWGLENNCTRMLSTKNINQITVIKTISSGIGGGIIAFLTKSELPELNYIFLILIVGFFCYGFSVKLYIEAQKYLKASPTASYYALSPYFAILFSILVLKERPFLNFYFALFIMIIAILVIYKSNREF